MYTIAVSISLPMSLIAMNLMIFTQMDYSLLLLYSFFLVASWVAIFWLGFVMAIVHYEVKKTYKKIFRLQWKFNNTRIVYKIKVRILSNILIFI